MTKHGGEQHCQPQKENKVKIIIKTSPQHTHVREILHANPDTFPPKKEPWEMKGEKRNVEQISRHLCTAECVDPSQIA